MIKAGSWDLGVTVELFNAKELGKAFLALPYSIQRKVLRAALKKSIEVIEQTAKALVPVDKGHLRDSIKAKVSIRKGRVKATLIAGSTKASRQAKKRDPNSPDPFYVRFVELGTVDQKPQPFLQPAFEQHKNKSLERVQTALKAAVEKELKKVPKKK